ncbi:hypothetical protein [Chitinophaga sp. sic0106]|uniref:hypothetical protein n=1 Tax=Chitinophaga sp. sic0106 TaxID=2854785 RepID=UPI001C466B63|nr:hypothetical protein [Chitinophaga sp. sic0106]MBV7531211.1 hypothetical protein [Chitinophaga sp. sic0106]
MKKIVLWGVVLLVACAPRRQPHCQTDFQIEIWDMNSSMAYSTHYQITNDSLFVFFQDGLEGGKNTMLFSKALSQNQGDSICNFFSQLRLDTFRLEYINPAVEDGDQKEIRLRYRNIDKKLTISNVYIPSLGELYEMINRTIGDSKSRIRFRRSNQEPQLEN